MASDGIFPDVKTMLTAPDDSLYKIAWPAYPDVKIMQTRAMEIYFQIAWYNLSSAKISILIKYQFYPPEITFFNIVNFIKQYLQEESFYLSI